MIGSSRPRFPAPDLHRNHSAADLLGSDVTRHFGALTRERGETVLGAAFRTVPFQYVWGVVALLVILAVWYLKPLLA